MTHWLMTCRFHELNPSSNSAIRALHLLGNTWITRYHKGTLKAPWKTGVSRNSRNCFLFFPFSEFWSSLHCDKGGDLINCGKSRSNSIHKNVDSLLWKASSGHGRGKTKIKVCKLCKHIIPLLSKTILPGPSSGVAFLISFCTSASGLMVFWGVFFCVWAQISSVREIHQVEHQILKLTSAHLTRHCKFVPWTQEN